jgi:hypothetical protein
MPCLAQEYNPKVMFRYTVGITTVIKCQTIVSWAFLNGKGILRPTFNFDIYLNKRIKATNDLFLLTLFILKIKLKLDNHNVF